MTITQAINKLQALKTKYGDVDVYFDCPWCLKSWAPDTLVGIALHLTKKKEKR